MSKAKRIKAEKEAEGKTKAKKGKAIAADDVGGVEILGFDLASLMDDVLDGIEKKTKVSSQDAARHAPRISTGCLALDMFLSGGIVPGGWYTFSGGEQSCKSTMTMSIMASLIRLHYSGISVVFDYEGSTDAEYVAGQLKTFGVRVDPKTIFGVRDDEDGSWIVKPKIRYYAPDNGERFFDYMSMLRRRLPDKIVEKDGSAYYIFENNKENAKKLAGKYDKKWFSRNNQFKVPAPDGHMQAMVIVDSYPAMMPDQVDDDEGSKAMALQARMFSDGIKRFRGGMRRKMMTIVGVNQLRQKPAVMFGCLHGTTKVPFVDGRVHRMKDIVDNKIEGEVWSYNEDTRQIEPRRITAWHNNGNVEDQSHWMRIITQCPETPNGQASITVTPNHEILTDRGWKRADEITMTDRVVSKYTSVRTGSLAKFLNAVAVGDSSMVADSPNSGLLKFQDNNNPDYVLWKIGKLENHFEFESYSASHGGECYIARGSDFVAYSKQVPEREPWKVKFDDLSFAVFYMDDGNLKTDRKNAAFSIKRFKGDEQSLRNIQDMFASHGFETNYNPVDGCFWMNLEASDRFFQRIRKYVPDCMQYKLPAEHQGFYEEFELEGQEHVRPVYVPVIGIEPGSKKAFQMKGKYDITVEHNHNYMVGNSANGIIVHNSPEYEPGGDALKFYCFDRDTLIRTDHGVLTAPQIKELLDAGTEVMVESFDGFQKINGAWKVDDAPFPIELNAGGHAYVGSAEHRQFTFMYDTTADGMSVLRPEWNTLNQLAQYPEKKGQYAGLRVPPVKELKANVPDAFDEASQLVRNLLGNADFESVQLPLATFGDTTFAANVLTTNMIGDQDDALTFSLWARHLLSIGIYAYADESGLHIPGLNYHELEAAVAQDELGAFAGISFEATSRQRQTQMLSVIADVFPELTRYVLDYQLQTGQDKIYLAPEQDFAQALDLILHKQIEGYDDQYDLLMQQLAYIDDWYNFDNSIVPVPFTLKALLNPIEFWDVNVAETSVVITNGFVSHNSDVRVRLASRAVPQGWPTMKDAPGIVGEKSVTVEGGTDRYRFIAAKTIKNKMGGIPNQQTWLRLWEADGNGEARGFDPVFDTWHYLKTLGLINGTRKSFKIKAPCPLASDVKMDWDDFRTLINGSKEQVVGVCKKLKVKPAGLRLWCFKFVQSAKGNEMLKNAISKSAKTSDDDDDE